MEEVQKLRYSSIKRFKQLKKAKNIKVGTKLQFFKKEDYK